MRQWKYLWAQAAGLIQAAFLICVWTWAAEQTENDPGRSRQQPQEDEACAERSTPPDPVFSRQEQLRQRRIEKSKNVQPQRPEFFEKLLARFDRGQHETVGNSNYAGFYPRFARISEGSGLAGGITYLRPLGDLDVSASAFYSVRGYRYFEAQLGALPDRGKTIPPLLSETEELDRLAEPGRGRSSRFRLYATARSRFLPQVAYFGSGPDSRRGDETNFLLRDNLIQLSMEYQLGRRLLGRFDVGWLQHSLGPGTRTNRPAIEEFFDESTAPGLSDPPGYWRLGGSLLLDYRDNPGVPHQGFALALGWNRHWQLSGPNRFNFQRVEVDARGYVPLGSRQRVVALRFRFVDDQPEDGNRVPFFLQLSLGDSHTLRGFDRFRFRGEKLMLYQAEYRWEPSHRVELALFADAGAVAGAGSSLSLSKLRSDFGIGFRVRTSRATVFRLEQAWSREASKTLISLSASF